MPSYTITQLVREFDLTSRTVRFYEDQGLLNPAREGRNRIYSPRDRTRLKLILRGKRLGLSLQEIRELMDMYESPQDTAQQLQCFLKVLDVHKQKLKQQLKDIEGMLGEIVQHEQHCENLLAQQKQSA
ncbi:MAG: MerR family DNA-binding transcriptional regulator [Burkholderiales bacterium]|jgi:DNA-binding transcriptional MerR regulator|nr:MerR family DNA-binding transcriptional regulator [Burkholderiales bacterium]